MQVPFQLYETVYTFSKKFAIYKKADNDLVVSEEVKIQAHINWEQHTFTLDLADVLDTKHHLIMMSGGIYMGNEQRNLIPFRAFFDWVSKITAQLEEIVSNVEPKKALAPMSDTADDEDVDEKKLEQSTPTAITFKAGDIMVGEPEECDETPILFEVSMHQENDEMIDAVAGRNSHYLLTGLGYQMSFYRNKSRHATKEEKKLYKQLVSKWRRKNKGANSEDGPDYDEYDENK